MRALPVIPCALFVVLAAAGAGAQTDAWLTRAPKLATQSLKAPSGEWTLEYPKKDWVVTLSGGSTLAMLVQRNAEASVALEGVRMNVALSAKDVGDYFLDAELELLKQEQRGAMAFSQKILTAGGPRVFVVQYERPGLQGMDRVRQYSLPVGSRLYRVQCVAPVTAFGKYEPVFAHVAASLSVKEQP